MLNKNDYFNGRPPSMTTLDGNDRLPLPGRTGGINPGGTMYTGTGGPLLPRTLDTMGTGGNLPPSLYPTSTGGPLPPVLHTISTGGPLPAQGGIGTGGNLPPNIVPVTLPPSDPAHLYTGIGTGGNLPPTTHTMGTGGNLPPQVINPAVPGPHRPTLPNEGGPGLNPPVVPAAAGRPTSFAAGDVVSQIIDGMMSGQYGQDAARRGLQLAQQRGLLNSSMAAGNSQRSALEAVSPFVSNAMNLIGQREQNAFSGEQNQLNRNLQSKLQSDASFQQDWLNSQSFNRNFYASMAMVPVQNAAQFQQMIAQYALDNPEVYTPQTIAGMTQFFNSNFQQIMSQYLPDLGG